jgi:integrase
MPRAVHSFARLSEEEALLLEDKTRAFHHASREPGTHRNVDRFVRYYEELCAARHRVPWPADPFDVACFLVKYCVDLESVASLSNALSAIRVTARERCGQTWNPAEEWYLKRVRRGLRKRYRARVKRKRPITQDILLRLLRASDLSSLADAQMLTLGFLAHNACLRLKEVRDLHWSDISWVLGKDGQPTAVVLTIRVSKARYEEAEETVRIPFFRVRGRAICAAQLLWLYMHDGRVLHRQNGEGEAFLFPSLRSKSAQTRIPRSQIVDKRGWFTLRLAKLGFEDGQFSGHSFRAGGATDLHTGNVPEVLGRLLGRWRSREAYLLYLRQDPQQQDVRVAAAFRAAWDQRP